MAEGKSRHGCLTVWLVLMLISNSIIVVAYTVGAAALHERLPNVPGWAFPVLALMGVAAVGCTIALFRWKKWGFWGFCAITVLAVLINLAIGLDVKSVVRGVIGILILYGVLQMGKPKKGWDQLD